MYILQKPTLIVHREYRLLAVILATSIPLLRENNPTLYPIIDVFFHAEKVGFDFGGAI